ncbi:hypothetical protein GOV03_02000 [Candidatus Woesearchaeota archaeon]|nr:hypothetical protein [Candidatus Woesearchaeota archaeon]
MKKINLLGMSVLMTSLFSMSVIAEVPSLGNALSGVGDFFSGLFTGAASMENAYFISFILYFILFLAVFMEGLSHVKIFGESGKLNKQGKFFAVAASALATIALFVVDQGTGMSTQERLEWLVAPFGIWGGVVLAAIVAFITYKAVKGSELFEEKTALAMAIAASVGVTFVGFLLGLENLLGWGFLIMLLVFVVGGIVAFSVKRSETKEDREEKKERQAKKVVESKKEAEGKADKEKRIAKRRKRLDNARDLLLNCIESADETISSLKGDDRKKAKGSAKDFDKYVRIAWKGVSQQSGKEEGSVKTKLEKLAGTLQNIKDHFGEQVLDKISTEDWKANVKEVNIALVAYKKHCGAIVNELGKFL